MKTSPWPSSSKEELPVSANEFSIGDSVQLLIANEVEKRVTFLAGAYTAVLCFRAERPCSVSSSRCDEALFSYDGSVLKILPGLQQFFLDVEGIVTKEQTSAFQRGVDWARESTQAAETRINHETASGRSDQSSANSSHGYKGGEPRQSRHDRRPSRERGELAPPDKQ